MDSEQWTVFNAAIEQGVDELMAKVGSADPTFRAAVTALARRMGLDLLNDAEFNAAMAALRARWANTT